MKSLTLAMRTLFFQELALYARQKSAWLNPLSFFLVVVALFPLGVSPEKVLLKTIGPGIIWVSALLASLLAAEYLFKQDLEEGVLDQLLVSPMPLVVVVWIKVLSHWIVSSLPLVLLSPLLALMLFLDNIERQVLFFSLLLGTPAMSFVSSVGAALTVGIRRSGVLLSLIILPLYIPILIFGTSAVLNVKVGYSPAGQYAILTAILIVSMTVLPFMTALSLRISISQR